MNRGHALLLQGDPVSVEASLHAYNEAIGALRQLPIAENPSWANSLGAALMNRGQLLHRLHGVGQAAVALGAFEEAAAILRPLVPKIENPKPKIQTSTNPWPCRNLAGTLVNCANLLIDLADFKAATTAAREALGLVAPQERAEAVDAGLSLKARRVLCDALGQLLVAPGADQDALAREASDVVDDSLALSRHWAARGETAFAPLALRLFRYGTQLYRFHQPHFLAEFIRENLPAAGAEFRAVALEAIDSALADRPRDREFLTIGDPASERRREIWRELADLRAHLAA